MAIFSFGGGVSKQQADKQAKDEARRAVKKANDPKPGDLVKKMKHTQLDTVTTDAPPAVSSTQVDDGEEP